MKQRYNRRRLSLLIVLMLIAGVVLAWMVAARGSPAQEWVIGEPVISVAFSPDRQLVAAGLNGGDIQIRRVSDGKLVNRLQGHKLQVEIVVFSPDGQTLASAAARDSVKLWHRDNDNFIPVTMQHNSVASIRGR